MGDQVYQSWKHAAIGGAFGLFFGIISSPTRTRNYVILIAVGAAAGLAEAKIRQKMLDDELAAIAAQAK